MKHISVFFVLFFFCINLAYAATPIKRHVLAIYDSLSDKTRVIPPDEDPDEHGSHDGEQNPIQNNLAVALNHYGYIVKQVDLRNESLPSPQEMEKYALIISWFVDGTTLQQPETFVHWIEQQVRQGRKYLLIEYPGFATPSPVSMLPLKQRLYRAIDIHYGDGFQSQKIESDSSKKTQQWWSLSINCLSPCLGMTNTPPSPLTSKII